MYDLSSLQDALIVLLLFGAVLGLAGIGFAALYFSTRSRAKRQTKEARHAVIEEAIKQAWAAHEEEEGHKRLYPPHFNKAAKRNQDAHRANRRHLQKEGRKAARKGK